MLYDCGWNLSEVSRRPPAPADVIHLSYSGSRLLYSKSEKVTEGFNQVSPSTPKPFSLARARTGANGGYCSTGPPESPRSCEAALPQFRMLQGSGSANNRFSISCCTLVHDPGIGLEIARALGCCTEIQDGC